MANHLNNNNRDAIKEFLSRLKFNLNNLYWSNEAIDNSIYFIKKKLHKSDVQCIKLLKDLSKKTMLKDINADLNELEFYLALKQNQNITIKKLKGNGYDFKIKHNRSNNVYKFELTTRNEHIELKHFLSELKKKMMGWNYKVKVTLHLNSLYSEYNKDTLIEFIEKNIISFLKTRSKTSKRIRFISPNKVLNNRDKNESQLILSSSSEFIQRLGVYSTYYKSNGSKYFEGSYPNPIKARRTFNEKSLKNQLNEDDNGFLVINYSEYGLFNIDTLKEWIFGGSYITENQKGQWEIKYFNDGILQTGKVKGGVIAYQRLYQYWGINFITYLYIFNENLDITELKNILRPLNLVCVLCL